MQAIFLDLQDQFLGEEDVPTDQGSPPFVMQGTTVFQLVPDDNVQILIYREIAVLVLDVPPPAPAPGT